MTSNTPEIQRRIDSVRGRLVALDTLCDIFKRQLQASQAELNELQETCNAAIPAEARAPISDLSAEMLMT